jgi:hypothetical protein
VNFLCAYFTFIFYKFLMHKRITYLRDY